MRRRALLLIGAAANGLAPCDVSEEIAELLGGRLRPQVRAQLLALIGGVGAQPRAVPVMTPGEDDRYEDDELLLGDQDGTGYDV